MCAPTETAVAIVGGGPVGLALALDLGQRGIDCMVIESRDRTRLVPRAKLANVRTMEHLRRWGIAGELREATPLPAEFSTEIAFVTAVLGHEITRFSNVFFTGTDRDDRFSEAAQQVPQYILEPVLRRAAERSERVTFREGWRAERVTQDDAGAELTVRHGDEVETVRAEFAVGCDGAGSVVRRELGIGMVGRRGIARNYGVVFRAPELASLLRFPPALHFWTVNATTPSYMGPADRHGLWWLQATAIDPAVDMDALDPLEVVYGALGVRITAEVVNTDPWEAHALTAERVRDGRVFLAGDAAHLHSPMGAHGMNQGIGDAVDLGWKIAATLEGWGGEHLLDSYVAERAPLHARVTDEATLNYGALANHFVRPGLDDDTPAGRHLRAEVAAQIQRDKRREFYSLGLVLGHVYEGSPITVSDGEPIPPPDVEGFVPRPCPGARAPHAWLGDGSSLFDRFGPGLTLLRLGGSAETEPLERAARERGVPLRVVGIEDPHVVELYGGGLALVRPDQVMSWRGAELPPDSGALLDVVTGSTAGVAAEVAR